VASPVLREAAAEEGGEKKRKKLMIIARKNGRSVTLRESLGHASEQGDPGGVCAACLLERSTLPFPSRGVLPELINSRECVNRSSDSLNKNGIGIGTRAQVKPETNDHLSVPDRSCLVGVSLRDLDDHAAI